jgi:hypothetical protein
MGFEQRGHLLTFLLREPRCPAASVRERIGGAGRALTAQEVANRGGTDAKQVGYFVLGVLATFIGRYDSMAEVVRVWSHNG